MICTFYPVILCVRQEGTETTAVDGLEQEYQKVCRELKLLGPLRPGLPDCEYVEDKRIEKELSEVSGTGIDELNKDRRMQLWGILVFAALAPVMRYTTAISEKPQHFISGDNVPKLIHSFSTRRQKPSIVRK